MNAIVKDINDQRSYHLPLEGEKHLATIVMLPYRADIWRDEANPARVEFLNIVKAIAQYELVVLVIDPKISYHIVSSFVMDNVHILRLEYEDSWARDTMPIFQIADNGHLSGVDFAFDGYANEGKSLYYPYLNDDEIGKIVLRELMISRFPKKEFVFEGGNINSDGDGTLLTSLECLKKRTANANMPIAEQLDLLKECFNAEKILALPYGVYEDETSGHIDNVCAFVRPGKILLASCDDENDPNYLRYRANRDYLENAVDAKGRELEIVDLPLPKPLYLNSQEASGYKKSGSALNRIEGRRLAASYVNHYVSEKFVLVPQFSIEEDEQALRIIKECYIDREVIPIKSREILLSGGNIHCVLKQIPYSPFYPLRPEDKDL